ncbi:MAG: CDP-2,3-bis-(O-geranylgeranyl)-sn-glycerol synthase [Candidatus Helarchaeota archaeon]|nr:CDP-2,3-bis-(O-geranylgeranyl)-sn-glycerol synthase [Candidatus Helarchaeota archaeon]
MSTETEKVEKTPLNPKDIRRVKIFCIIIGTINILCVILMTIFWSIYDYLIILGLGMLTTVPAFFANAGMTFAGTYRGVGRPIDGGRNFIDGKRILGNGKTWKGFLGGILIGSTLSWLLFLVYLALQIGLPPPGSVRWLQVHQVTRTEIFNIFIAPPPLNLILRTILLSVGACVGDLVGSFFKRRFKRERGTQFPLLDQLDFLLMAYLFAYAFFPIRWYYILVISIFTPLVAILANIIAYAIGKKDVPW